MNLKKNENIIINNRRRIIFFTTNPKIPKKNKFHQRNRLTSSMSLSLLITNFANYTVRVGSLRD